MLPFIAVTCSTFRDMLTRRDYDDVCVSIKTSAADGYRRLLMDHLARRSWVALVRFAIEWFGCEHPSSESLPEDPDKKGAWDTFRFIVEEVSRSNGTNSEEVTKVVQAFERRMLDQDRPDLVVRLSKQYPGHTYAVDNALGQCAYHHIAPKCTSLYVSRRSTEEWFAGGMNGTIHTVHSACMRTGSRKLLRLAIELEREYRKKYSHEVECMRMTYTMRRIAESGSVQLAEEYLSIRPELAKVNERTRLSILPSSFGSLEMLRWYVSRGWIRNGDKIGCTALKRCVWTLVDIGMLREMASLNLDFRVGWKKWGLHGNPQRYEGASRRKWADLQHIFHWLQSAEGMDVLSGCSPTQLSTRIIREKDYAEAALCNDDGEEFARCYRSGLVRDSFSSLMTTSMYEGALECCRFLLQEGEHIDVDKDWIEATVWKAIACSRRDWNGRHEHRCLDVVVAILLDDRFREFATGVRMTVLASNCARVYRHTLVDSLLRYARAEGIDI